MVCCLTAKMEAGTGCASWKPVRRCRCREQGQRLSHDQRHDLSTCGHLIASFTGDLAHMPSSPANCARLRSPALLTSRLQNVLVIVNDQGLIQSQCPIIKASLSDSSANGRAGYTVLTEPPLTTEVSTWSANACHCGVVSFNVVWLQNLKLHLNGLAHLSEYHKISIFLSSLCREVGGWGCYTELSVVTVKEKSHGSCLCLNKKHARLFVILRTV